ncbi:hypothetical protein TNCV_1192921 [Trichonephila clavipes]|nr:hypothetical protein TNCV_1192921 [Trichonephila clavipes]
MLTAMPWGLGSNSGEEMDVCKCTVPLQQGGTLNSRGTTSALVKLVEAEERTDHLTRTSAHAPQCLKVMKTEMDTEAVK